MKRFEGAYSLLLVTITALPRWTLLTILLCNLKRKVFFRLSIKLLIGIEYSGIMYLMLNDSQVVFSRITSF